MFHNRRQLGIRRPYVVSSGAYVGPGDVVTFFGWWGLRGYNAAYSGHVVDIADSVLANPLTVDINTTTHLLDTAAIVSWSGSHGTPYVTKIYDQTGGGNDLVASASAGAQPELRIGASGLKSGYPAMIFITANSTNLSKAAGLGTTFSQPWSMSAFGWYNTSGAGSGVLGDTTNFSGLYIGNQTGVYAGASVNSSITAVDGWVAAHCLAAGAGSYIYSDSTADTGDAGSGAIVGTNNFAFGRVFAVLDGRMTEAGIMSGDQRSSFPTLVAQQRTFWL